MQCTQGYNDRLPSGTFTSNITLKVYSKFIFLFPTLRGILQHLPTSSLRYTLASKYHRLLVCLFGFEDFVSTTTTTEKYPKIV